MRRRKFIKQCTTTGLSLALASGWSCTTDAEPPDGPVPITTTPQQHWFGYYDKQQVDPTGRYALGCEVDLFFRSPTPDDVLKIGLIDLEKGNRWTEIGASTSWGWQQGCMLQWIPGSGEEVIWNDHEGDRFVSRIYNIKTRETRTLPRPVYALSPDGSFALTIDFDRLQFFRPGYGYPSRTPVDQWPKAPADAGIYRMDLRTGASRLLISYAQIAAWSRPAGSTAEHFHWFNHLLINPAGNRFIFLSRSRPVASPEEMTAFLEANPEYRKAHFSSHWITRAVTADTDGGNIYALNDSGLFSHFIWKGDDAICAWAGAEGGEKPAFYLFRDRTKEYGIVGEEAMPVDGHNTYVPGTNDEWILCDTYPQGRERLQELYLYHVPSNRKVVLGRFHEPEQFTGEWRCDLHPRCDQQGKRVFFDSTHEGGMRQMYMVDISGIVRGI